MAGKAEVDLETALAALAVELGAAAPHPRPELAAGVLADAALTAFAAEARARSPRPGPQLAAGVLADAAVTALAAEVRAASPRPGPELVAGVLADAAAIAAAASERAAPARRPRVAGRGWYARLAAPLFGWAGGAVVAMTLGLVVGLGVGLEAGPGMLPVLDAPEADPLALAGPDSALLLMEGP